MTAVHGGGAHVADMYPARENNCIGLMDAYPVICAYAAVWPALPYESSTALDGARPDGGSRGPAVGSAWAGGYRWMPMARLTFRLDRRYLQVMRSEAPALLPVFRSPLQADILAALLLNPEREYSITDLARRFGAPLSTVHGEVKRLTDAGLLRRRDLGRSAMIRANTSNRLVEPLTELLFLSWGPLQVIAEEFAGLDGAERVLIFGSWAARYLQQQGPPPHDLDVLVVGHPARGDVYDAADRAQQRLGMQVDPVIRPAEVWREAADPLVQQIQSGPFVVVLVPDEDDQKPAGTGDA